MTAPRVVPLTCHGHSRPITHLSFSPVVEDGNYYLFSACKDNNPILRNGITGDWIGTFIGHKGAVWSAKLSEDVKLAATGSADYTAKVWNAHTGEVVHDFQHNHIVRSVAFLPKESPNRGLVTAGADKKVRLWDFRVADIVTHNQGSTLITESYANGSTHQPALEIGPGSHGGSIKSVVFTVDNSNMLVTAAEETSNTGKIRWFDIRGGGPVAEHTIEGPIGSCELNVKPSPDGAPFPTSNSVPDPEAAVFSVAAGKSIYFFSGFSQQANILLRRIEDLPRDSSCAALDISTRRFVTGCKDDTHVHVYDYDEKTEMDLGKGHHGPVWITAFSPDGKLYASGSEDGTIKLWKWGAGNYGLWRGE